MASDWRKLAYIIDALGSLVVSIGLSMIFGFSEDYQKIIGNVKHEFILISSCNDKNLVIPYIVKTYNKDISKSISLENHPY